MTVLPPLRLPRALVEATGSGWPAPDDDGLIAVVLEHRDGRWVSLKPAARQEAPALMALPPLVEAHAHLDKVYSWAEAPNRSGWMDEALSANRREHSLRQAGRVAERAERALQEAWQLGLRAIRSHVDSLGPGAAPAWEVLPELARNWRNRVTLQLVAMVPISHWATAAGEALAAEVAAQNGLLGGVLGPPFRRGPEDERGLEALLRLAERHGCGIDLHVDESASQPGAGVTLICRLLEQQNRQLPICCSHAASMALLPRTPQERLLERMANLELTVVALPRTNHYLLARQEGCTPLQRPLAPIRQLQAAGVTVAVGGDNVQDPWFPGGDFDPLALLREALPMTHLLPWQHCGLAPFTTAAARLLRLEWDGVIRLGGVADLIVIDAGNWSELLVRSPQRRVLRAGSWLPAPSGQRPAPSLTGTIPSLS
ncbi:MAG: amidohydrolase family protein [Cyanobacteriota bacterium]